MKRLLLCALLFCSTAMSVMATNVFFKHVDASDGLSNNRVNTIYKDSNGFIWFGTIMGLNRWDGQNMKAFVSDSRNAKSLPDNDVESIQEARDGMLWIKTGAGYTVFDPRTEEFDTDINSIMTKIGITGQVPQEIKIDRSRNIWINVKGEGVYFHKPSMKLLYEFTFTDQRQSLPEGEIISMVDSQEGMICCYSNGSLVCLDGEHQRVVWQEDHVAEFTGGINDRYAAFCDRKDNVWLWNSNTLFVYRSASNSWLNSLSELAQELNVSVPPMEEGHIRCLSQDSKGRVWIATDNSGILLIDPAAKSMELLTNDETNGRSLRSNSIQTLFVDNNDVVWVGTAKHGVSYFSEKIFKFDADWLGDITAIAQDGSGNLWLGTSNKGVICKNTATGELTYYTRQKGLVSDMISCLAVSGNRVWVGSPRSGLNYIENGKVSTLHTAADGTALASKSIQALAVDAHGNLWIGTQNAGLQSWNAGTGLFTIYNVQNGNLPSDNVTSLNKSGSKLLIGTNSGLVSMQIESKKFKTYIGNEKGDASFRSNSVICTLGDSRGFYWIGTREGLAVYDPKTDCLALIGAEQGLADESVFAITEDTQKNVWITTSGGISKITVQNASQGKFPASFSVTNYNQQDGLQNASFNQNSILTTSNGIVYFGGMSGLNSVEANAKKTAAVKENLLFTRIFVDGDEVEIGKYYGGVEVLPSAFYTLDKVSLPNNASIEICVTSDCFARSEKLQYVYKLDGIDNAWVSAGEHNIVYRNLPAGKYLLHLKGLNSQGEEKTLTIVVEPIFWLTTRAFILYAVVIALIILWLMWMRPRYKARRSRFKAMEEQLANLKNLAEEFRAPVSTMIPPLNSLVESEEDSTKREYLTTIHYQATQILNLTNKLQGLFEADQVEESIRDMRVKAKRFAAEDKVNQQTSAVEQAVEDVHYQVLLVDDNEEFLSFLKDSLPGNFDVLTATSGSVAWDIVSTEHPQLVVCESNMEDMTGSDLCVRMKSSRDLDKIPFILVTDSASASEIGDNGINNRVTMTADDYIAKPFNIQVLIAHMYKLLGAQVEETGTNAWDMDESAIESMAISATMDEQLKLNAEQFVLQNVSRASLSVEEMAKSLNMSRAHLYKKLVAITGKTPVEFVRSVRLKQAAMLLHQSARSVEEIAFTTGFASMDAFLKYFKEEFEKTPEEYRRSIKNQ